MYMHTYGHTKLVLNYVHATVDVRPAGRQTLTWGKARAGYQIITHLLALVHP